MQKSRFSNYNDGMVFLYRRKDENISSFKQNKNIKSVNDLNLIVKLAFEESVKRERDLEFAEKQGFSLSVKVKTRLYPDVDNDCVAVIDGCLYSISYSDKDRHKNEMWLYLERIGQIAT